MKPIITVLLLFFLTPLTFAGVDEGTVTWVDGKGKFEVKTERNGTIILQANADLLADELQVKQKRWPHLYKEIKPGDYISLDWGRDEKTRQPIARFVSIKKRKG